MPEWQEVKKDARLGAAARILPGSFLPGHTSPLWLRRQAALARPSRLITSPSFLLHHPAAAGSTGCSVHAGVLRGAPRGAGGVQPGRAQGCAVAADDPKAACYWAESSFPGTRISCGTAPALPGAQDKSEQAGSSGSRPATEHARLAQARRGPVNRWLLFLIWEGENAEVCRGEIEWRWFRQRGDDLLPPPPKKEIYCIAISKYYRLDW